MRRTQMELQENNRTIQITGMKIKRPQGGTIACCILLLATILAYLLTCEILFPWLSMYPPAILFVLLPVLATEIELFSGIKYFKFGIRKSKIATLLRVLRLICSAIVILLGFLGWLSLMATLFERSFNIDIPFYFGIAVLFWGVSKLLDSIWAILYYRRFVPEKNAKDTLSLAGKFIFSLLICYLGYWAMLFGAFMSISR